MINQMAAAGLETDTYKDLIEEPTEQSLREFSDKRLAFAMGALSDKDLKVLVPEIGIHKANGTSMMMIYPEVDTSELFRLFVKSMTAAVATGAPVKAYHTMCEAWMTSLEKADEGETARVESMPDKEVDELVDHVRKHGKRTECVIFKVYAPGVGELQTILRFGRDFRGCAVFTSETEHFWNNVSDGNDGVVRDFAKEEADKAVGN